MRALLRPPCVLTTLPLLLLVVVALAVVTGPPPAAVPLYTPTPGEAPRGQLLVPPGARVRLRGILRPWWQAGRGVLVQAAAAGPRPWRQRQRWSSVVLRYGAHTPLLAQLRQLPLVGALLPPSADRPLLNRLATFTVRVARCAGCPWQLQDGGTP